MNKNISRSIIILITTIVCALFSLLTTSASPMSYTRSDTEMREIYSMIEQGRDYLGLLRLYAKECGPIKGSAEDSEDLAISYTAGLLNYEKGNSPAFISAFYNSTYPEDGVEFEIKTAASVSIYSEEYYNHYRKVIDDTSVNNNCWYEIYTKDGIDYLKISNSNQNMYMYSHEEVFYKFNGKTLSDICNASEHTTIEYDSQNDSETSREKETYYEISGKVASKEMYEDFIKSFKLKQTLFSFMAGCPVIGNPEGEKDFQYLLDEFKKIPSVISIKVDEIPYDFIDKPVNINGKTLAPLRAIGETMGAKIIWDAASQRITLIKEGTLIELTVGSKSVFVDNEEYILDVPATLINNKAYIPVRFIVESLGWQVDYNSKSKEIMIHNEIPGDVPMYEELNMQW
ncbi:copper amine oxidase N-terminal domain-containing protein [Lutispora sp.]|uniref:copper amine oxidase N-terminal domain-containing protein n=1 Tax=Lutispora sp. TaxID=2828727 RepID=UPI003569F0D2